MLRERRVVGKFVEFYGPGLTNLPLADRATIGNMSPEYGATCGIFPVDAETLRYLRFTGRSAEKVELVEAYCRAQGLFHEPGAFEPVFSDALALDLGTVEPSLAGPRGCRTASLSATRRATSARSCAPSSVARPTRAGTPLPRSRSRPARRAGRGHHRSLPTSGRPVARRARRPRAVVRAPGPRAVVAARCRHRAPHCRTGLSASPHQPRPRRWTRCPASDSCNRGTGRRLSPEPAAAPPECSSGTRCSDALHEEMIAVDRVVALPRLQIGPRP